MYVIPAKAGIFKGGERNNDSRLYQRLVDPNKRRPHDVADIAAFGVGHQCRH